MSVQAISANSYTRTTTEAARRLKVYQEWFYHHVMPPSDENGQSSTVMVLLWTTGGRSIATGTATGPRDSRESAIFFFCYNVGPYAEAPGLIIPGECSQSAWNRKCLQPWLTSNSVGTTPYVSKHTGRTLRLPTALGLMGAKGSDVALARIVSDLLEEEEIPEDTMMGETKQKPLRDDL